MLAPERAPKRYWAARPPEPWQTGMAPNQQPTRLTAMTLNPKLVVEGVWMFGRRSWAKNATAMTELRVVRGSWPMPASKVPLLKFRGEGIKAWGRQRLKSGRKSGPQPG